MVEDSGKPFDIKPGTPSTIERIEHGLLSQGNDMTLENNPFEIGLGKYCDLDQEAEFIGKDALRQIKAEGIKQTLMGVCLPDIRINGIESWHKLTTPDGKEAGKITSLTYSPRLKQTIANAMIPLEYANVDTALVAHMKEGKMPALVRDLPFIK